MENEKVSDTQTDDEGKDLKEPTQRYTEEEKAEFNLRKAAEKAKEHGIDPYSIVEKTTGKKQFDIDEDLPDDAPLTVGTLREIQKRDSKKTALALADEIEDEDERREVKHLLENRFISSDNPSADLNLVRSAVGAKRTAQLAEENARKGSGVRTAAGGSASGKSEEEFVPTEQESVFMKHPYNLSKEKIIEMRKKQEG